MTNTGLLCQDVDHHRFHIDSSGQILDEKTLSGFNLETIRKMRSHLAESELGSKLSAVRGRAKRRLRKAVTGNPDKKVRDYMKEVPQVKLVDKLSFTFGVMVIIATEFLALRYPQYFTVFYLVLITGLLVNRFSLSLSQYFNFPMFDCDADTGTMLLSTNISSCWTSVTS